jgi:hypothetical protein
MKQNRLEEVTEKLQAFLLAIPGNNAAGVAIYLKEKGIKGKRSGACHCPIANLIRTEFPELGYVGVSSRVSYCFDKKDSESEQDEAAARVGYIDLPSHVLGFVHSFDTGSFGFLVG